MLTTNFSLPFVPGTVTVSFLDAHTELGEMPRWMAVASTNGLNAEPGWRWPCVARLNGCDAKFSPPTIARTSPVALSIATSDACGPPGALSHALTDCSAACCSLMSSVVEMRRPPSNARRAP